jgi:GNAT superfamily N-acetyltransferase
VALTDIGKGITINIRQIEMYKADPADLPDFLFDLHRQFGECADLLRVAKIEDKIVAGYALTSALDARGYFCLDWIAVSPELRLQGLGRWVIGHAMGVAESKSGGGLRTPRVEQAEFFQRLGFASADGGGWQLEFLPE